MAISSTASTAEPACAQALSALAGVRSSQLQDAARHEARLRFAAQCFDAVLQLSDDDSGERLRLARSIMESHVAAALAFAAQSGDAEQAAPIAA